MKYRTRTIAITISLLAALLGSANPALADYSPGSTIDFGSQPSGTTSGERQILTLVAYPNSSGVIQLTVTGGDFHRGPSSTCPGSAILPLRSSCILTVVFQPTSVGLRTGSVIYHSSACGLPCPPDQTWTLRGTGTTPPPPPPPAAPTGLTATAISSSQINLVWNDNSTNETGFSVQRAPTSIGPFVQTATTGPNVNKYADTNLSPATTYFYRVLAFGAGGQSGFSSANATTLQAPPPPAPCDVNADGHIDVLDVQLTASQAIGAIPWTPAADINHDGSVNVIDVQRVVNASLGLACNTN